MKNMLSLSTIKKQGRKVYSTVDKFTSTNPFLYTIVIISFLNVLGLIKMNRLRLVNLYLIIAFILRYFISNMAIVLGLPLLVVNFASYWGFKEGLETKGKDTNDIEAAVNKVLEDQFSISESDYDVQEGLDDLDLDLDEDIDIDLELESDSSESKSRSKKKRIKKKMLELLDEL